MLSNSVKIKIRKNSKSNTISHIADLEKLFPGNKFLKDEVSESSNYLPTFCALEVCLSLTVALLHCIYSLQSTD